MIFHRNIAGGKVCCTDSLPAYIYPIFGPSVGMIWFLIVLQKENWKCEPQKPQNTETNHYKYPLAIHPITAPVWDRNKCLPAVSNSLYLEKPSHELVGVNNAAEN